MSRNSKISNKNRLKYSNIDKNCEKPSSNRKRRLTELKHPETETESHKFFNMQKDRNNFTDASSNVIAKLQSLEKPVYWCSKFSTSNATKKLTSDTPSALQTNSCLNINNYQLKSTRARSKEVVQDQMKSHHQSLNYYSKFENSSIVSDLHN